MRGIPAAALKRFWFIIVMTEENDVIHRTSTFAKMARVLTCLAVAGLLPTAYQGLTTEAAAQPAKAKAKTRAKRSKKTARVKPKAKAIRAHQPKGRVVEVPIRRAPKSGTVTGYLPGSIRKQTIHYSIINGDAVIEGDIVLGPAETIKKNLSKPRLPPAGVKAWKKATRGKAKARMSYRVGGDYIWSKGRIPFNIDMKSYGPFAEDVKRNIERSLKELNTKTKLNFVPKKSSDKDYIRFRSADKCSSQVGQQSGKQYINLGLNCVGWTFNSLGTTMHESLHAAGFWHTQSRDDRDDHVKVIRKNIESGHGHNFDKHDDFWAWLPFGGGQSGRTVGVYDIASIMHYGSCYFSKHDDCGPKKKHLATLLTEAGDYIVPKRSLAASDISSINTIYKDATGPKHQFDTTKPLPLKIQGYWGSWASSYASCPAGSYAYAFRQKVHAPQGDGFCGKRWNGKRECKNDDTGLNAIQFKCRKLDGSYTKTISSKEGPQGTWSSWKTCRVGKFLTAFQFGTLRNQGGSEDDIGAMNIKFTCSDNQLLNTGQGTSDTQYLTKRSCESGEYIRAFRTQVERPIGGGDDTALNGFEAKCIKPSNTAIPKYLCDEGVRDGASNCKVKRVNLASTCQPGKAGCPYWIDTKYKGIFRSAIPRKLVPANLRAKLCTGRRGDSKYCCPEGVRSGKSNCRVASFNPLIKQKAHCRTKQPKNGRIMGCAYWIDTKYTGIFKKAIRNPDADHVKYTYHWYGTAPFCGASSNDCKKRGMDYIRSSKRGDGAKCWTGKKVLCRKSH